MLPPLDDSQDGVLRIQTGPSQNPPRVDADPDDPYEAAAVGPPQVVSTPSPWSPNNLKSSYIVGTGDSYLGQVGYSYDATADAVLNQIGAIDVRRVAPYGSGADLELGEVPPPLSSPNPPLCKAMPLPVADQAGYHAKSDDPVLVITGRDGRGYYIPDNRPFIATVDASPGNSTIAVTRKLIAGDPTSGAPTLTTSTSLQYPYVYPIAAQGQHHGYFEGDYVLCFRRGEYVFCLPGRVQFHGKIVNEGPASEADFADERYWVQIKAGNVTGSPWDWDGAGDDTLFTVTAANLVERADGTHLLPVDADLEVVVTLFADSTDKAPYWVFALGPDAKVAVSSADDLPGFLRWTDGDAQAHDKLIGDAEAIFGAGAAEGQWIECEILNDGNEEQLRINHIGPGDSCYLCCDCIMGMDIDEKGHVRGFNTAACGWVGPCTA